MSKRTSDLIDDPLIVRVNPDDDTSPETVDAFFNALRNAEGEWIELPVTAAELIGEAWRHRDNITIHDAVYVVLAQHLDAPLLTADRKLAAASNLPIQVLHLSVAE